MKNIRGLTAQSGNDEGIIKFPADSVHLTLYLDALDAFRSPKLGTVQYPAGLPFTSGTVSKIDGHEHTQRRRVLNQLTKRDGHRWFRQHVLFPAVARRLDAVLQQLSVTGHAAVDLVPFSKLLFLRVGASLVGLDGAQEPEVAEDLLRIFTELGDGFSLRWFEQDEDRVLTKALTAKQEFSERFFQPALAAHRDLVARYRAATLDVSELPHDFLVLVALEADPRWSDVDLALRDAAQLVNASHETSTMILVYAMDELEAWFLEHPSDFGLRTDATFLYGAVTETLRLHPTAPAQFRIALEDVTFPSGIQAKAGQHVAIRSGIANRDHSVFGSDAERFNPRRKTPSGLPPYGLGFGGGAHLCFGLPLVLGSEGIDGVHVHFLKELYAAGLRPDPSRPTRKKQAFARGFYESYPVIFDPVLRQAGE